MCLWVRKLRKTRSRVKWKQKKDNNNNSNKKNSGDRYWNRILYVNETVRRDRKKRGGVSSRMYYLKFTFKGPEYTRNIVFLMIFLQIFLNINPYLCRLFRGLFWGGGSKITLSRLKLTRIMLETRNLVREYICISNLVPRTS